ncbi:hypothetical protein BT69DRAFT_1278953 [Atractiella rhizophila]|nr:hypothetical protein BT69DRAFT_1278953 [Atractiella rhizophila]
MSLSPAQSSALTQYQEITSLPPTLARQVLEREGWDLQRAVEKWVEDPNSLTAAGAGNVNGSAREEGRWKEKDAMESMEIDDSEVVERRPRVNSAGGWVETVKKVFSQISPLITLPISLIASLLSFITRILHLRSLFPYLGILRPRNPFSLTPRSTLSPAAAAEHYIRFLEETTGHLHPESTPVGTGTGVFGEGGSGLVQRKTGGTSKMLPEFLRCGYSEALQAAKDELKILMVVLSSAEHEDDEGFRKTVLTDQNLRRTISENDILVWGGDIKYRDAFQASQTLAIPRLPTVAFIALQPRTTPTTLSSHTRTAVDPVMKMFSRLSGSPSSTTSPNSIIMHIQNSVLPRVSPFLGRLRVQKRQREEERELRRRQDEEYERAVRKDTERVLAKRREEEEKERRRQEGIEKERLRAQMEQKRQRWREWAAVNLVPEEWRGPGGAKVAVKLTDGRRLIRTFKEDESTTIVYAWIECEANGVHIAPSPSPSPSPVKEGYDFTFKLVMTFPRKVVEKGLALKDVGGMVPNANLVVESLDGGNGGSHTDEEEEEED